MLMFKSKSMLLCYIRQKNCYSWSFALCTSLPLHLCYVCCLFWFLLFLCTFSLAFHLLFGPWAASLLLNWLICISQGVVTHLRCSAKYVTSLVANLQSLTVKEFLKSANISQSYERISSGTFLWPTVYYIVSLDRIYVKIIMNTLLWGGAVA